MSNAHRLVSRYQAEQTATPRDNLIRAHARLLERHARAVGSRTGIEAEELWSVGAMALIDAAGRYDPSQGAQLETFLGHRVRGAMLDEVRRLDRLPRRLRQRVKAATDARDRLSEGGSVDVAAVADVVGCSAAAAAAALNLVAPAVSADDIDLADSEPSIVELLVADERVAELERAVDALPERLQMIVSLRYVEDLPQRDIAKVLGVSEARVSQLLKGAIAKLRMAMGEEPLQIP
jgi:RNA polymerase sigma factor for flagellar operon FliA